MKYPILLFLGDSLIDYGVWPQRLPDYRVICYGAPGETAAELLQRLPTIVIDFVPDAVIVMTGTNNLFITPDDFPTTINLIVSAIRCRFRSSTIILTTLPPFQIPGLVKSIQSINHRILEAARHGGCRSCELHGPFSSRASETLFSFDGIHLSEAGYQVWTSTLRTVLDELAFVTD